MQAHRFFYLLVALILLAGAASAVAGETDNGTGDREGEVVLFTNADLAKYGPPTGPDQPVADAVAANTNADDRAFVEGFIDSQYERLDAERKHAMEVAATDQQRREEEWDGWSGRLLLAPWSYWGYDPYRPWPYDDHAGKRPDHGKRPVPHGRGSVRGGGRGHDGGRYVGIRARGTAARVSGRR